MLILSPYSIPFCPLRSDVKKLLGRKGFLIDEREVKDDENKSMWLREWAEENPEYESIQGIEYSIITVYSQYLETNPKTDFEKKLGTTKTLWRKEKLSRIFTIWLPLGSQNESRFLISVGNLKKESVLELLINIDKRLNHLHVRKMRFDFEKLRWRYPEGWMHGCDRRPGTIQKGTLFGDFDFSRPSELDGFMNRANGTVSKQEGIFIEIMDKKIKIRVLDNGRFQVPGFASENFLSPKNRREIISKCFVIAGELAQCADV